MEPPANRLYLTTREVAARLRVSRRTVRWLIHTQKLCAHRIADEFLIEESDLAAFIDANTVVPPQQWGGGLAGWT
jgi:excisionase family DNA binding protein